MLYNPNQDSVFTVSSLITWLETQPPEAEYVYIDPHRCLLAQYFTAMGFKDVHVTPHGFRHKEGFHHLSEEFESIATGYSHETGVVGRRTFGAALERARKLI